METWGCAIPNVLNPEQNNRLKPLLENILSWWWKGAWGRVEADALLNTLLIRLIEPYRNKPESSFDRLLKSKADLSPIALATKIWLLRPRAKVAEVAALCDYLSDNLAVL